MQCKQVALSMLLVVSTTACPLEWGKEGFLQRAAHKDSEDNQRRVWEEDEEADKRRQQEKSEGDKQAKPCAPADACIEKKHCPPGQEKCQ